MTSFCVAVISVRSIVTNYPVLCPRSLRNTTHSNSIHTHSIGRPIESLDLDKKGGNLYFTDPVGKAVRIVPADGGNQRPVFTNLNNPQQLRFRPEDRYAAYRSGIVIL